MAKTEIFPTEISIHLKSNIVISSSKQISSSMKVLHMGVQIYFTKYERHATSLLHKYWELKAREREQISYEDPHIKLHIIFTQDWIKCKGDSWGDILEAVGACQISKNMTWWMNLLLWNFCTLLSPSSSLWLSILFSLLSIWFFDMLFGNSPRDSELTSNILHSSMYYSSILSNMWMKCKE